VVFQSTYINTLQLRLETMCRKIVPQWAPLLSSIYDCIASIYSNGRGNSLRWLHNTLYPQKLALTLPTSGGRSVGIVPLRTTATEFSFF
jgi:hypothetical protein